LLLFLCRRLFSLAFVLLGVSILVFWLMHSVPGGPFDTQQGQLTAATRANLEAKYGLDEPVWKQYLNYMSHALRFDFGIPYQQPQTTVAALIGRTWLVTLQVGLLTIVVAFSIGICAGLYAAYHQNSWLDHLVTFCATLGVTVPNFVIGMWLILCFSVARSWLPLGGWGTSGACLFGKYFIRTARAKGLSEVALMRRHVLPNAQIPMVTALGTEIPNLITGSIFIETIFRINGLGKYFVTSALNRDYPMIMATFLLIALLWGVTYMLTDVAYTVLDPRIQFGRRSRR
jgi:ABC-type dipeptide/oligopeptide/nickel transport system permease component